MRTQYRNPASGGIASTDVNQGTAMNIEDMIIISVDDHIVEPPNLFDNHLTQAQKAFAPKVVRD